MQLLKYGAALGAAWLVSLSAAFAQIATDAEYAILMDYRTGATLFAKNARAPTAPASMSKLMTVAIVFEKLKDGSLKLTDEFDISEKAWRQGADGTESKMWVRVDTKIPLEDLLRGIIVQSGNDACIVIAENISGSEEAFAELMNAKAREWGLNDSTFVNSHGMPHPDHKMSMRDIALLARKIISEYGDYYSIFSERVFTWERIRQENRNPLLDTFQGADGLKTGHTQESGYGLAGSAVRNGERRILIVNGIESERQRATETARLMRIAFDDFATKVFYQPGDIVGEAQVFKGKQKTVPLIAADEVSMIVHRSTLNDVKATVIYRGPVAAPVRENQQIGVLRVEVENGPFKEYPLYAGRGVGEAGVFGKIALAAKTLLAKPEPVETDAETVQ